ncbi:MAG: response regulator [Candidatus Portnoybacteria bacterium]|nr:response regulator [Candidatus Portnoybacteria bacterium]
MAKIIFVEDEPTLQKTLCDVLLREGYDVKTAFDGVTGLKMIKQEKPDLVLLDLILPKIDGFSVLQKMRDDPETKDIPVMILTNLEGSSDIERVLELGATTYLVKANYELREVVDKIKKTLEK